MLKFLLISSFIFFGFLGTTQNFIYKHSYLKKSKNKIWTPDNTGNMYLYGEDILSKESLGQLPNFSQSIKSIGAIDQILPINALKTYLFSETQQQICLIDNTLSIQANCVDLEEFNIQYALLCAVSGRPNLIYVFDQFNSTLFLINTKTKSTIQKVSNLKGLLGQEIEITALKEYNNDLFLKTSENQVYQLDMFLNLKKEFLSPYNDLTFYKGFLVDLEENKLIFTHLESNEKKIIPIDEISASELKVVGNSFYFSTKYEIKVYEYNPD